ncbi:hypothetical protein FRC00_007180, partial [Tulasnella sp. 408]
MEKRGPLPEVESQVPVKKREDVKVFGRFSLPKHHVWMVRFPTHVKYLLHVAEKVTIVAPTCGHPVSLSTPIPLIAPPSRPLEWGDVNFIHTTDTHGWLLGHQKVSEPEPNASGNLGDLYSFIHHMKELAAGRGADLLVVDSGDMHDGNGLSDGFSEGGVDGHEADLAGHSYKNFAPKWKGRYLTSNVNITMVSPSGQVTNVPVGERYAKFTTSQGRKVTALGVLFNFVNYARNTTVQEPELLFQDVIEEEPDFFLLLGHMAVYEDNWPVVFAAIRERHPQTPIFIFGGHTHIRDCVMLDDRSMALESGRYMETVGWMSATLPSKGKDMKFSRRYLDNNRVTYQASTSYHTNTTATTFDTPGGLAITRSLYDLVAKFNLGTTFGVVPQDYYLDRLNEFGAYAQSVTDDDAFVTSRYNAWRKKQYESFSGSLVDTDGKPLTLGYVTTDKIDLYFKQCPGGPGDDTPHRPIPIFDAPGYVGHSNVIPSAAKQTMVDVIFLNFFLADIVKAANELRAEAHWDVSSWMPRNITVEDAAVYGDLESNQVFGKYASAVWNEASTDLMVRSKPGQVKQSKWASVPAAEKTGDTRAPRPSAVKANNDPARNDATHMSPLIQRLPKTFLLMVGPSFGYLFVTLVLLMSVIDAFSDYWTRFKATVQKLNDEAGPSCSYKVLFIGRHGEGYHNAAEAFYGTK